MASEQTDGLPALGPGAHPAPVGLEIVPVGPRMFVALCWLVAISLTSSLLGLVLHILVALSLATAIGRLGAVVRSWRVVALVSLSLLVVYSWAYPGSTEYVWVFGVEGFFTGLLIAVRLLAFVTVMYLLLISAGPLAIVEWAGDVNEDLGIMVSLTLSVLPVMKLQMDVTMQAQVARGLNTTGGLVAKIKAYLAVLIPVVVKSLVRAYGMAALLHVRGYGSGRRVKRPRRVTAPVVLSYGFGLALIAASIVSRRLLT